MDFRTVIRPSGCRGLVNHGAAMLMLGSCFTDNIGRCLRDDLFDVEVNPFGPVYNPLSLLTSLRKLADGGAVSPDDLFERDGQFCSFMFHSRLSGSDRMLTAKAMTEAVAVGHEAMSRAAVVILTLGTTRVFTLRETGLPVTNCHKVPASEFDSRCLSLGEVIAALCECVDLMRSCSPSARIIFTVSPLRYLESGAHGNQLIKATLLLAVDEVIKRYGDDVAGYFPAYEIMMDDLRDYRFYAEDMKHPSDQAVRYIYDIFRASYFTPETDRIAAEARALTRRLSHRQMAVSAEAITRELASREVAADSLIERFPILKDACLRYREQSNANKK